MLTVNKWYSGVCMLLKFVKRVFELFREVNGGFPENRTGYIISMAQCKMKMRSPLFKRIPRL